MSTSSRITNQLKAIVIFEFLNSYNKLEKLVRLHFEESLANLDKDKTDELYFLTGGLIKTFIDYNNPMSIQLMKKPFKIDSKFTELTTNQILKMNRKSNLISLIKKNITSEQSKMTEFIIEDCIIKLLEMRNLLAHDIIDCTFKDKHLIEVFVFEKLNSLSYPFLKGYDLKLMDDMTKDILSNYIYMQKIINCLEVKNSN